MANNNLQPLNSIQNIDKVYVPFLKWNGKYAYVDSKKMMPVFKDSVFDDVGLFYFGLAIVKLNGKYGIINIDGNEILPIKYDLIENFCIPDGYLIVHENKKVGLFDTLGKEIVPTIYDYIRTDSYDIGFIVVVIDDKYGILDKAGNVILPIKYRDIEEYFYSEGFVRCYSDKPVLIDITKPEKEEKEVFKYDDVGLFIEGLCVVKHKNKMGFIDKSGKVVIPIKYDWRPTNFRDGLAKVELNNKAGIIDKNGHEVVPIKYNMLNFYRDFNGWDWIIVHLDGKVGSLDKNGQEILPLIYDEISPISNDLAVVYLNKKMGIVDIFGNVVKRPTLACTYKHYRKGLIEVKMYKGKIGLIDEFGNEVITPKYDDIFICSHNYFEVQLNNKFGIINRNGNILIPIVYDYIGISIPGKNFFELEPIRILCSEPENFVYCLLNGKYGLIELGTEIKVLIKPKFDEIIGATSEYAKVRLGKKTFFVNKTGKEYRSGINIKGVQRFFNCYGSIAKKWISKLNKQQKNVVAISVPLILLIITLRIAESVYYYSMYETGHYFGITVNWWVWLLFVALVGIIEYKLFEHPKEK